MGYIRNSVEQRVGNSTCLTAQFSKSENNFEFSAQAMLVFSVLSLLVSFTLAASCCPRPLSTKEAYQQSEVVFYATVKDGTVVEAGVSTHFHFSLN